MKGLRAYVAGLLTGVAILCVPIYADSIWETITVIMNGVEVKVDGQSVDAPNFVYNDTTYVPLRKVAEMLGQNVTWVEEENTAYIGRMPMKDDQSPIAMVNDESITVNEFIANAYNSANSIGYFNQIPVTEENKKKILEELIKIKAVNQYAKEQGFEISDENKEIIMYQLNMQAGNDEDFEKVHMSFETYKSLSLAYFSYNLYCESIIDRFMPTEEEAKAYYNQNKDSFEKGATYEMVSNQIKQVLTDQDFKAFENKIIQEAKVVIMEDKLNSLVIE